MTKSVKHTARIVCDIALALLATLQMIHQHVPDEVHQIGGVLFGVLIIVHLAQHSTSFAGLRKGRWNALRIVRVATLVGILACAVGMMVSGLVMSTWVVGSAGAHGTSAARSIHLPLVHVAYCAMGLHAGLQIRVARTVSNNAPFAGKIALILGGIALMLFAVWSLMELNYGGYILGTIGFEFIDPSKPIALSFIQHLSIFGAFTLLGMAIHTLNRAQA